MIIKSHQNNINYFVTSDLHFGHKNIIKYSNRPFSSVEEMDDKLIENWNSVVSSKDIVFNLGDFAFSKPERILEIMGSLNGTQIFVYGNHDKYLQNGPVKEECLNKGYVKYFCDYVEFKFNNKFICMSHYAMRVWNRMGYGSIMLYGHSHGTLPSQGNSLDVGVDTNDLKSEYKPFLLSDVIDIISFINK